MIGYKNRRTASFAGSVYIDDSHMADIELDGSGKYQGERKLWRFRLVHGHVEAHEGCEIRMQNRSRPVRFAPTDESNYGYIELL